MAEIRSILVEKRKELSDVISQLLHQARDTIVSVRFKMDFHIKFFPDLQHIRAPKNHIHLTNFFYKFLAALRQLNMEHLYIQYMEYQLYYKFTSPECNPKKLKMITSD